MKLLRALAIPAGLFLAGCGTFSNAPLDSNPPPAVVRGAGVGDPDMLGRYKEYVCFTRVDGKATMPLLAVAFFAHYPREVCVTGGSHTFTVRYVVGGGFASGDAWIDTYPGRTYLITPVRTNGTTMMQIRSSVTPAP